MAGKARARLVACAVLSGLMMMPHAAQAQRAGHADSELVVTAVRSKLSNWRQAETSHVIVLSDGSQDELIRLTRNLERLHWLLTGLLGPGPVGDDTVKLRITLIGDVPEFDAMHVVNRRWQQGPFNEAFQIGHYYDPRADGAVMAVTRADQRVPFEHTPVTAERVMGVLSSLAVSNPDPNGQAEMMASIGSIDMVQGLRGPHDTTVTFGEKAMEMSAESLLYAAYAQHYLLTYFPAAYSRWYLDGFGQVFGTMAVKSNNQLEFGRAPNAAQAVMHEFGPFPIKAVLDDSYLDQSPHKTGWTPVHAWALTHFLFFSDARRPQLRQYLAARARGEDAATAARVFGDQKQLGRDMVSYFYHRKPYLQISYDGSKIEEPVVRRLRESEAAFVKGRLELGARIEIPPAPEAGSPPDKARVMAKAHEAALKERDQWLADLRRDAARWSGELEAQLLLAEAECRSGHGAECLAAARRAEAIAPADSRVPMWKGLATVQLAAAAPAAERGAMLASARALIVKANQIDHDAVGPLMAYYASFAEVGEAPSTAAIDGLQRAMEEVPNAPETRLTLATALTGRGQYDVARPVIIPVAAGPYDTPETPAAKSLLAKLDAATSTPDQSHGGQSGPAGGAGGYAARSRSATAAPESH